MNKKNDVVDTTPVDQSPLLDQQNYYPAVQIDMENGLPSMQQQQDPHT